MLAIAGPVHPEDIAGLCRRVAKLLERARTDLVVCDVSALDDPDAVVVDALAQLQLAARRKGGHVRLFAACPELADLLELMGLRDVVPSVSGSVLEVMGQTEEGEDPRGVEEEGDSADPIS